MTQPSQADRDAALRIVPPCICVPSYKDRGLIDPDCAWCDHGDEIAEAIAQARAEGRAEGMEAALEIASAIEITAPGLDICTWGEGVGDGIGAARETIVDAIRAASKEATK